MSLLYAIETCLRATRVPPSRFGREAVKDPRLVHDLRRGRQPGAALERRIRAHIAESLAEHATAAESAASVTMRHKGASGPYSSRSGSLMAMQGDR